MDIHCGVDLIELDRFKKALSMGDSFKNRIFTPAEIAYCEARGKAGSLQSYAVRFCAKEAVVKALGTGIAKGISFQDIEIKNKENGKPEVILTGEALNIFKEMGAVSIDVSLAHSRDYAMAQAVFLTKCPHEE
ncbi:MAG: holo-ACP synthase [Clostridiaceae bacterium]|jgi:holo-[acyl-carrier protein] synthase|nr:holo-ACP synthase [Clostridiaceae bacterium]